MSKNNRYFDIFINIAYVSIGRSISVINSSRSEEHQTNQRLTKTTIDILRISFLKELWAHLKLIINSHIFDMLVKVDARHIIYEKMFH